MILDIVISSLIFITIAIFGLSFQKRKLQKREDEKK